MDLTEKKVTPFDGELVKEGKCVESVLAEVEKTLEEPAQLVELALDKYIVDYLREQAVGYESESPLYNFSLTMNESIYFQLQDGQLSTATGDDAEITENEELFRKMDETADKLYKAYRREQKEKGLMEAEYVQLSVALAKDLYALVTEYAQGKGMDVKEAIHELMYQDIYLDKVYSLSDVEDELGLPHVMQENIQAN